jgi:homogentisate 1,2-dioxygenase
LKPHKLEGTMAFMLETRFPQRVTRYAADLPERQAEYGAYGAKLQKHFNPGRREP